MQEKTRCAELSVRPSPFPNFPAAPCRCPGRPAWSKLPEPLPPFSTSTGSAAVKLSQFMQTPLSDDSVDFSEEDDSYEILTSPDAFEAVSRAFEEAKIAVASAEITMIPDNYVTLTNPDDIKNLNRTLDLLEEDDDVQAVYHNWEEE